MTNIYLKYKPEILQEYGLAINIQLETGAKLFNPTAVKVTEEFDKWFLNLDTKLSSIDSEILKNYVTIAGKAIA